MVPMPAATASNRVKSFFIMLLIIFNIAVCCFSIYRDIELSSYQSSRKSISRSARKHRSERDDDISSINAFFQYVYISHRFFTLLSSGVTFCAAKIQLFFEICKFICKNRQEEAGTGRKGITKTSGRLSHRAARFVPLYIVPLYFTLLLAL